MITYRNSLFPTPQTHKLTESPDALSILRLRSILNNLSGTACDTDCRSLPPVILCIGTDRIIGDCLGPLAGSMLKKAAGENLAVYGTLENTVHALNLQKINQEIKKKHHGQIIIAIDASLGSYERVGSISCAPDA